MYVHVSIHLCVFDRVQELTEQISKHSEVEKSYQENLNYKDSEIEVSLLKRDA